MHKIGRYTLEGSIGQGGNGVVYRSTHPVLNRPVAVKALHQKLIDDPEQRERFMREARVTLDLNHPGIVNVYDVDQDGEQAFIAMELFEHGSLNDALDDQSLSLSARLDIAAQVAEALAYAHRQGVIHRDIKPSNVLLRPDGTPVVADFGLALDPLAKQVNPAQAGEAQGTPAYMAPEQIRGGATDGRTDMYALGVLLYELVSGRVPFDGPVALQIHGHLNAEPPRLRELDPALPWALDTLVARMLAKHPAQRAVDMAAVAAELRSIRAALPDAAAQPVRKQRSAAPVPIYQPPLGPATHPPATDETVRLPAPAMPAPPTAPAPPTFASLPTSSGSSTPALAPPSGRRRASPAAGFGAFLFVSICTVIWLYLSYAGEWYSPLSGATAQDPEVSPPALTPLPMTVLDTPLMSDTRTLVAGQERWTVGSVSVYEGQYGVGVYGVVRYDGDRARSNPRIRVFVRDPGGVELFSVEDPLLIDFYEHGDYGAFHVSLPKEYGPMLSTGQYSSTFEIRSTPLVSVYDRTLRDVAATQTRYGRMGESSYAWETMVGGASRRLTRVWAYVILYGPDGRVVGVAGTNEYFGDRTVEPGDWVRFSETVYNLEQQPASMVVLTKADVTGDDLEQ